MGDDDRVVLATVMSNEEASLLAGALRAEGFDVVIESRTFSQEPVRFGLLGDVRLWVGADELERAREALARLDLGASSTDDLPPELAGEPDLVGDD